MLKNTLESSFGDTPKSTSFENNSKNTPQKLLNTEKVVEILRSEMSNDEIASLIQSGNREILTDIKRIYLNLTEQNKFLALQNQELKKELENLTVEFNVVSKTLQSKFYEEQLVEERRLKVRNRRRLPKRDPVTKEIYEFLMDEASSIKSYTGARLRIALVLLQITGVRVSELLPLKLADIESLFLKKWIAIDRKKLGPASHKVFLTPEEEKLLKQRMEDLMVLRYFKNSDSYMFTAENDDKPLSRETFTTSVNIFLREAFKKLPDSPNLKSHSFRSGFITQLWKDSGDIEFVRQSIGHTKLDSTFQYVKSLTDKERQEKMKTLGNRK